MTEWQPIETAPKDGTFILLSGGEPGYGFDGGDDDTPSMTVARWNNFYWMFAHYDSGYHGEWLDATHWMPLPDPPTVDDSKERS